MSPRTIFLAKLLGLYCLLMALAMLLNKPAIMDVIAALAQNAPLLFVVGVFTLFAGLAMVLGHNLWRGGAVTVIVTVIGWLTLLKALLILFFPPSVSSGYLLQLLHSDRVFYVRQALMLLLGVYLTYAAFAASSETRSAAT